MTFHFYYRILNSKGAKIGDINSLRLLLGHATLDRLYRDGNHRGGDDWGWRY